MQMNWRTESRSRYGRLRSRVRSILPIGGGGPNPTTDGESIRTTDDGDGAPADDVEADGGGRPGSDGSPGNLFHCPDCGIVYVAAEKRVCSQCDGDVEQVPSTLSRR